MPPRRGDGFAEAVSSPAQINQRFIFGMGGEQGLTIPGLAQLESQAGNSFSVHIANLYIYRKNSKIWDTSNDCHNSPKNRKV